MSQVFIQLGRSRALALAEVSALFPEAPFSYEGGEVLYVETELSNLAVAKLNQLGASPRWGEVLFELEQWSGQPNKMASQKIFDYLSLQSAVKIFSFSALSFWGEFSLKDFGWVQGFGLDLKKLLKAEGRAIRFFVTKNFPAPVAVLQSEGLAKDTGRDLVFLMDKEKVKIGRSRFLQDGDAWSARDYERPAREAQIGMLPPKLARAMVNLALGPNEPTIILDPFCGTGTVLQEATLVGFKNIIGADASAKQVDNTSQNLKQLNIPNSKFAYSAEVASATKAGQILNSKPQTTLIPAEFSALPEKLGRQSQPLIVTEPYLGLPHSSALRKKLLQEEMVAMTEFYRQLVRFLDEILVAGGRACFVAPVWHQHDDLTYLPIDKILNEIKTLKIISVIPKKFQPALTEYLSPSKNILYGRDKQLIWRELWLLEKI